MNNILRLKKVPEYNYIYDEVADPENYQGVGTYFEGCNYKGWGCVKSVMYNLKKYITTDPELRQLTIDFFETNGCHGPIFEIYIKETPYNPTLYSEKDLGGAFSYLISRRMVDPWSSLSDYGKNIVNKIYEYLRSFQKETTTGLHTDINFSMRIFLGAQDGAPLIIKDFTEYKTVFY